MAMIHQLSALFIAALLAGCGAGTAEVECPVDEAAPPPELAYTKTLDGVASMDEALAKVEESLEAQGFGIVTRMDFQKTMKAKLDKDMRPYHVLGACHAPSAFQALQHDDRAGLLLPCKVAVYEKEDGSIAVSFARPGASFSLLADPGAAPLAETVDASIRAAFDSL
ncbi:MAG: DUF302 domain-containing protein [Deltaproteobacteria bacterium]|nr:DUF302 domain-containing protein [Deltaproteobacteria bacterium]